MSDFFKALRQAFKHGLYHFHNLRWQQKRHARLSREPF
jgi:hypothetical protein